MLRRVRIATLLGTLQSGLTNFKYLRKQWQRNCEEERLLGVSLTGQMGHVVMNGSEGPETLREWLIDMRRTAVVTNKKYAKKIGINESKAITTVKPSGTVSQLTNVSSGMHAWHDEYYIRSVRGDKKDPLSEFLIDVGIPTETDIMNENGYVFSFPRKAPEGAVTRNEQTALDQLNIWKAYKEHWTDHNPSITVSVKEDEWIDVASWVYENWDGVGGISFLPYDGGNYKQAPYQTIDSARYKSEALSLPDSIDWSRLSDFEKEDTTSGSQELACTAGSCELVDFSNSTLETK